MIFPRLTDFLNSAFCKLTALILLSVCTILFFNFYERYIVIGPNLIVNSLFNNNLDKWEYSSPNVSVLLPERGIARLHSDNPSIITDLSQTIHGAERYPLLKLSCDIKTNKIAGQGKRNTARVILVSHDPKGVPMYQFPHALANLHGTSDWEHHEGVFTVTDDVGWVRISVQLTKTTGIMWVKNMSLVPIMEKSSFSKLRNMFILLWIISAFWIAAPLAKSAFGNTHRSIIIALALVTLFGTLMPERLKEYIGRYLLPSLTVPSVVSPDAAIFKFTPLLPTLDIYKAGHFIMFAMLATAALYRRSYPASRARMLGYLLLFALVTEILQLLVAGRTAQFGDVIIDSAGIAMGVMFPWIMRFFSSTAPNKSQ